MGLLDCLTQMFSNWHWSDSGPDLQEPPAVNPATGLPMIGGQRGVDVAGTLSAPTCTTTIMTTTGAAMTAGTRVRRSTAARTGMIPSHPAALEVSMIHGAPDDVPLLERLIARLEVSPLATVPFSLSILSVWPLFLLVCAFQALSGIRSAVPVIIVAACWCALAGCEVARNIWTMLHPYASPRWLRSVHAAVGDDLAVRALAYLIWRHDHEPDYVVKRSDVMSAVQVEREERRDARRRAEGFRLVEAKPVQPDPDALADAERRRRARERRAARAARSAS